MFQKLFLMLTLTLVGAFSFVALAQDPGATVKGTNFSEQNTKYLPGVPKAPTADKTNLTDDWSGWNVNGLLTSIKLAINRVLGLLALIALIILIYQGVLMLINARDSKKIEEWYTTVKNVAIALVFIGVSWLIVSFIFRAIGQFTNTV